MPGALLTSKAWGSSGAGDEGDGETRHADAVRREPVAEKATAADRSQRFNLTAELSLKGVQEAV